MLGLACPLFAVTLACAVAAEPAPLRLENASLAMVLDRQPAPYVAELVHKASGRKVVAQPALKNLFRLSMADPSGKAVAIESSAAGQSSARLVAAAGQRTLRLDYGRFPGADVAVHVTALAQDDDPLVRWSIAIDNPGRWTIAAVRFPIVVARPTLDDGDDDFVVLPAMPGTLVENPAKNLPRSYTLGVRYPGDQSAQFLAYQDRGAGVYLASMDTQGWARNLMAGKRPEGFELYHDYVLPADAPPDWKSPYQVALGVTAGTWCDSADIYKRWAVAQPWCARTLAQREDIPAFWKQGPCIHTCEVRTYDRQRACSGSYYPQLLEHLCRLRDKIEGPIVPMLAGWENHRRWTAGDYFPVFDEPRARPVIAALSQQGFRPFFYLSGMFYTYENEGVDGGPIPGAERYAESFVIDQSSGRPQTFTLNESNPTGTWKRHSYEFCPAAPGTKEFFRAALDRAHALGVDVVQMDQTTSGASHACWSTSHGHPAGPGPYQSRAFWELLLDMRHHGRRLSRDFVLLHEEPHEELIPYLDGFHTREYMEGRWYRGVPGARGIPLFSYLYHEYAICYGGEGPPADKARNPFVVWQHAINLASGKTPAVAVWSNQSAMAEAHPDQIRMLRNHARLLKTEAQRFLMLGRMLHPLELDVPWLELPHPVRRGSTWKSELFRTPGVLTSSWQSPEGLVGHLLVNIGEKQQSLRLGLDTRNAPPWPKADVDLYDAAKPGVQTALLRGASLPAAHAIELEPLGALFFVIRPTQPEAKKP